MANVDDLAKAFGAFNAGLQQYAITSGINDATKQVDALNQQQMDAFQKRQAQQDIAKNLQSQLAGYGASNSQISAAVGAITPPAISSANDAYMQAVQSGDPNMMKMANQMQKFESQPAFDLQKLKNQGDLAVANAKVAADRVDKVDAKRQRQLEQDFMKLGGETINPSSRKLFGLYQGVIDSADGVKVLLDQAGMPEGQMPPPGETRDQRIQRFNNLNKTQVTEIVKGLDRMISRAAPTESGQEGLTPDSWMGRINDLRSKVLNAPVGRQQGAYLNQMFDSVMRERGLYSQKQDKALGRIGAAYKHLKEADPERFNAIISGSPDTVSQQQSTPTNGVSADQVSPGPAPAPLPPGIPPGSVLTVKRNKTTRQWQQVYISPDNQIWPAPGQ